MASDDMEFMLRATSSICDPEGALALDEQEQVIERGLQSFIEIGRALATIRDGRLYLHKYSSFEAYCRSRWNLTRKRAYDLMSAATVVDGMEAALDMAMSPIGDTTLPANEGQARELAGLDPAEAVGVMNEVNDETGGKPTAAAIRDAVRARQQITATDEDGTEVGGMVDDRDPVDMSDQDWIDAAYDADALIEDEPADEDRPITEPSPAPAVPTPRRRPLPESFDTAVFNLKRAVDTVARLTADDRLEKNKDQVKASNLSDLVRVRDALNGVINTIEG
ncbi:hypothetical protein nbrc107696_46060 [Gordonia spumicola]|uniref:Uncharacterized protein n=1 Tax=Gordonia spumicola TaxID=589161 RepID=A0A7I9V5D5_9ACTN|nr:hypothetical protein [Gordonia spumicola]GEE00231.1 hypothetical protein nbrc107696_06770 [Gordonia spumicola]GEE04160.1 hypothetical protein nbrc107696_46060 [Gordonia spumicola]